MSDISTPLNQPINVSAMQFARQYFVSNRVQWLTIVYTAVIIYISLHPVTALRFDTSLTPWNFLYRDWVARDIHLFDNLSNLLAYLPLGFGMSWLILKWIPIPHIGWRMLLWQIISLLSTALLASIFSLTIEMLQTYSPARIAASIDIVCNGLGALVGAFLALFIKGRRSFLMTIISICINYRSGAMMAVLSLWTLAQINSQGWVFMTAPLVQLSYTWLPTQLQGLTMVLESYQMYNLERSTCIIALLNVLSLIRLSLRTSLKVWHKATVLLLSLATIIVWQILVYVLQFGADGWNLLFSEATIEGLMWVLGLSLVWAALPSRLVLVCTVLLLLAHIILAQLLPAHPYMSSSDLWRQARLKHLHGLTNLVSALWPILALFSVSLHIRQLWLKKYGSVKISPMQST
jgi:VanZ family protein